MDRTESSPLGRPVPYVDRYDPGLLHPVPRAPGRAAVGITGPLPFTGVDRWTAYELSWLDRRGKPQIALASLAFPADSANLIESKSLKLYLNSFSHERLDGAGAVRAAIATDLAAASGAPVEVRLTPPSEFGREGVTELDGESLDDLEVDVAEYVPNPALLSSAGRTIDESLVSNLLKSNCPITGQPDWGSVQVRYRGPRIDRAGLLRYIVSFRRHQEFHEQCVERMFVDLLARCRPEKLTMYARYTRRGGLDINPFRTNAGEGPPPSRRTARQ
jgi:7-cyano-7-deazaguanine reductase